MSKLQKFSLHMIILRDPAIFENKTRNVEYTSVKNLYKHTFKLNYC